MYRRIAIKEEFVRQCYEVSSNEKQLCDILLDVCYTRECSKQLCWDIAGKQIIKNLIEKNGGWYEFPVLDSEGDITFDGKRFSMRKIFAED